MAANGSTNVSEQQANSEQRGNGEVRGLDKPNDFSWTIYKIDQFMWIFSKWRRHNGRLGLASLETLLVLCGYWTAHQKGMTLYAVSKKRGSTGLSQDRFRLEDLMKQGLVMHFGKAKYGAIMYAPTSKAIEELQAIIEML